MVLFMNFSLNALSTPTVYSKPAITETMYSKPAITETVLYSTGINFSFQMSSSLLVLLLLTTQNPILTERA